MILDEDANAELVELVLALANAWKQARPKADATMMCWKPTRYLSLSAKDEETSSYRVLDEMNARSGDQTMTAAEAQSLAKKSDFLPDR